MLQLGDVSQLHTIPVKVLRATAAVQTCVTLHWRSALLMHCRALCSRLCALWCNQIQQMLTNLKGLPPASG